MWYWLIASNSTCTKTYNIICFLSHWHYSCRCAPLAQLVEQWTLNPRVAGSSPAGGMGDTSDRKSKVLLWRLWPQITSITAGLAHSILLTANLKYRFDVFDRKSQMSPCKTSSIGVNPQLTPITSYADVWIKIIRVTTSQLITQPLTDSSFASCCHLAMCSTQQRIGLI